MPELMTEALEREALRLWHRYTIEIVEGLGFCPWVEAARRRAQVREAVDGSAAPDPKRGGAWVRSVGEDPGAEVGFLIFPLARFSYDAFAAHVRAVRDAYDKAPGPRGVLMAIVGFHPVATADTRTPMSLVSFVRRSPDPTIQVIRLCTLEALRQRDGRGTMYMPQGSDFSALISEPVKPHLHEVVAQTNHDTVQRLGVAHVEAMLADIRRDRDETYRALGLAP